MTSPALKTRFLDLPALTPGAKPAFGDAGGAKRWAEGLPTDNGRACNELLRRQLDLLTSSEMHPDKRLDILDALRPHVIAAQAEHARKYHGKPAPLLPHRRETLAEVSALWDALSLGYQRCLEGWAKLDKGTAAAQAQALQRAIDAVARLVLEHYYAYVVPPRPVYGSLHRLYSYGERYGFASMKVRDPLADSIDLSPRDSYVRALLFDAALPREHRPHVLEVIFRLLASWTDRVAVQPVADGPTSDVPPLYVDLGKDRGLRHIHEPAATVRQLDMSFVAQLIHDRLHQLRHGRMPNEIEAGVELSMREFETLLIALHRQWCEGAVKRQFERQPMEALAHVSTGLAAAHFYLGKQPFRQPFTASALPSRRSRSKGDATAERIKVATDYLLGSKIAAEEWMIRDESLTGIGLIRPQTEEGEAWLTHGLLIAVRPRGGGTALVGTIQWLEEASKGDLHVGVRLLPGVPAAVAARAMGEDHYFPALMLLPRPPLAAPSSIVMPPGTFAPLRVFEVFRQGVDRIQLTALLESGVDFERAAFMPAGSVYVPSEVEAAT